MGLTKLRTVFDVFGTYPRSWVGSAFALEYRDSSFPIYGAEMTGSVAFVTQDGLRDALKTKFTQQSGKENEDLRAFYEQRAYEPLYIVEANGTSAGAKQLISWLRARVMV